ncbi:MAG: tetratricopeptide repeat protein [Oceanicaulis sp.]|nr:tetratricopeptide repeat protein [Oceanicaulis sp.]
MRAPVSAIALVSLVLTGCGATSGTRLTPQEESLSETMQARSLAPATADERAAIRNQDLLTQSAFWAEAYQMNPADREAALELATILRRLGGSVRAAEIARQSLALYPDDIGLLTQYALAQTASGQGAQAVESFNRVLQSRPDDWRIYNAYGVALEQAGRSERARARFMEALALNPGEPAILTNLAMTHMLAGDPEEAERLLRQAVDHDRATPESRQNLALALALQGRFDEAETIARSDLPANMAAENMDFVRALMRSPRSWDRLREAELRGR